MQGREAAPARRDPLILVAPLLAWCGAPQYNAAMQLHPTPVLLALCLAASLADARAAAAPPPAGAGDADAPAAARRIYQQRLPDGRVVLTDRPQREATTERTWTAPPEDAVAAQARREEARLAAVAVDERIGRQIEAQRQRELALDIERMRLSAAQAAAQAERARLEESLQPVAVVIPGYRAFVAPRPPRHWHPRADRPEPGRPPARPPIRPRWSGYDG